MYRGDSVVSEFQMLENNLNPVDPLLDLAHTLQVRGDLDLPELKAMSNPEDTCLDMMAGPPGRLCSWVHRHGTELRVEEKALEVVKWIRVVACKCNGGFESMDPVHGLNARKFHDICVKMLVLEQEFQEAKKVYLDYSVVIRRVGNAKRLQEKNSGISEAALQQRLAQVDRWETHKLADKEMVQQMKAQELQSAIATFSELLLLLLSSVEDEQTSLMMTLENQDSLAEAALCAELDANLKVAGSEPDPNDQQLKTEQASPAPLRQSSVYVLIYIIYICYNYI